MYIPIKVRKSVAFLTIRDPTETSFCSLEISSLNLSKKRNINSVIKPALALTWNAIDFFMERSRMCRCCQAVLHL
jgi:hypothetical protein